MKLLKLEHGHPHIIPSGKDGDYARIELIAQMQAFFAHNILNNITEAEIELFLDNITIH